MTAIATDGPRVLVVDDEPRNLNLVEALLAGEHLRLERASGGREAIELYRSARAAGGFDLVLLDVMMPEVDGLTALREMRASTPEGERVPIVLVTALGAREDRLHGLEAGADDFLTKPLDPNELRCRVRTFLSLRGAQRALRARADELERVQRAKAELSRMLVHDLKNPLAGVGSNLGWIERRLAKRGIDDRELLEALADARASADRLVSMVGGLIDIEKAESGQLRVQKRVIALSAVLSDVARRHLREIEARGIALATDAEAGVEAEIDPDLVARVLENLVENAVRYTPEGGRLTLSARAIAGAHELVVANTGDPIPEALRAKIFEKHQSGEDKSARGRNLGLGLYFCKLAAEAHGGTIDVDSTAEWPTRFVLRLPPPSNVASNVAAPKAPEPPRRAARSAFLDG